MIAYAEWRPVSEDDLDVEPDGPDEPLDPDDEYNFGLDPDDREC